MKTYLIFILLSVSNFCFGQKNETGTIYYGTNNKVGFELNIITKKNISYGFGVTYDLTKKNIGGEVPKDIYDASPSLFVIKSTELYDIGSLYGTFGYHFSEDILIGIKIGFGSKAYYNYLEPNSVGNYFKQDGGTRILYGGFMTFTTRSTISPYMGLDNYNGLNVGITCNFR
jgi:hypothetical protein